MSEWVNTYAMAILLGAPAWVLLLAGSVFVIGILSMWIFMVIVIVMGVLSEWVGES